MRQPYLRGRGTAPAAGGASRVRDAAAASAGLRRRPPAGEVLAFRRRAVKPRRRRRSPWLRLLRPAAWALLIVGA
ncbi:MAG TPA: hypothetical protein VM617_08040, partial [Thermoanaerobaculia bacterium]|nr:hypothetical protein [Thermoanaerobaculia bacterium]